MGPMPGAALDEHRCILQEGSLRLVEKQGKVHPAVDMVFLKNDVQDDVQDLGNIVI